MSARELDMSDPVVASSTHEVVLAAYRVEAELIGSDAIPALHETLEQMRQLPLRWLGVGDPLEGVLGWAREDGVIDIDRLCVRPDRFRRGLASLLLVELLATTGGAVTVATGAANEPAIALYTRHGFSRIGSVEPEPGLTLALFRLER